MDKCPDRAERFPFIKAGLGIAVLGLTVLWMWGGWRMALVLGVPALLAVSLAVGGAVFINNTLPGRVQSPGCAVTIVGLILLAIAFVPEVLVCSGIVENNESSGMLAFLLLLTIGGLAVVVTLVGLAISAIARR